jgi:hypothetical protein
VKWPVDSRVERTCRRIIHTIFIFQTSIFSNSESLHAYMTVKETFFGTKVLCFYKTGHSSSFYTILFKRLINYVTQLILLIFCGNLQVFAPFDLFTTRSRSCKMSSDTWNATHPRRCSWIWNRWQELQQLPRSCYSCEHTQSWPLCTKRRSQKWGLHFNF